MHEFYEKNAVFDHVIWHLSVHYFEFPGIKVHLDNALEVDIPGRKYFWWKL